jgi:hypothetical protein
LGHAADLLLATACATPPAPQVATPLPPGQARIWFYRLWDPSESLNAANIDVNGVYFGSVEPGWDTCSLPRMTDGLSPLYQDLKEAPTPDKLPL